MLASELPTNMIFRYWNSKKNILIILATDEISDYVGPMFNKTWQGYIHSLTLPRYHSIW